MKALVANWLRLVVYFVNLAEALSAWIYALASNRPDKKSYPPNRIRSELMQVNIKLFQYTYHHLVQWELKPSFQKASEHHHFIFPWH